MSKIQLTCKNCGKIFEKDKGEYNRRIKLGCNNFFCSCSCSAQVSNAKFKAKEIIKECPTCGKLFKSSTKAKAATFCSRSCASKGSVNEARRNAGRYAAKKNFTNLETAEDRFFNVVKMLRKREAPRYETLKKYFIEHDIKHEFEYPLAPYIYDLFLPSIYTIVEFDEPYHKSKDEKKKDNNVF